MLVRCAKRLAALLCREAEGVASVSQCNWADRSTASRSAGPGTDFGNAFTEQTDNACRVMNSDVRIWVTKSLLLAVLFATLALDVSAQRPVSVGDTVVPRGELKAREHDPSTFSLRLSDEVATIRPDEHYVVEEVKTVKSILLREHCYLRIRGVGTNQTCREGDCWVYLGLESSDLRPNLVHSNKTSNPNENMTEITLPNPVQNEVNDDEGDH